MPDAPLAIREQRALDAARSVWDWRHTSVSTQTADHPRRHQAVQGLLALSGSLLLRLLHAPRASFVAAGLGVLGLALAAVAPVSWLRAIRRALDAFGHVVGVIVSTVVLSLVYFGFMFPAGLLSRQRKDSRYRGSIDRGATSYWTPARPSESSERQF